MNSTLDLNRNDRKNNYKNKEIRRYKSENSLNVQLLLLPKNCNKFRRFQVTFGSSRIHYSDNHSKSKLLYYIMNVVVNSNYYKYYPILLTPSQPHPS